jgi:hypothetical protein
MTDEGLADRIDACARLLLERAREMHCTVTGDLRVCEGDAAALLCLHPDTLKNLRTEGEGPTAYRLSVNGSRWSYRIEDLARWIEAAREHWIEGARKQGRTGSGGMDSRGRRLYAGRT